MINKKDVLLISENFIKENSIVEENFDSKILRITIKESQNIDLRNILGLEKYNEILEEVALYQSDENYDISEENLDLLENYIQDFLVYATLLNIPTSATYKLSNKGYNVMTDSNGNIKDGKDVEFIKRFYRSKYDTYRLRLMEKVESSCKNDIQKTPKLASGWYLPSAPNPLYTRDRQAKKY